MLSRIIISMAMAAALFTAPGGLAGRSCILSNAPNQKACHSSCCANKTCCATSPNRTARTSQPLAQTDSSYKLNTACVGLISAVSPSLDFADQLFLLFYGECSVH